MTPATPASEKGSSDDRSHGQKRTTHNESINTEANLDSSGAAGPRVEPSTPPDLDESSRSQVRASTRQVDVGKQALADETGPTQDTDKGPVLDQVYNETLAPDRGATRPRE